MPHARHGLDLLKTVSSCGNKKQTDRCCINTY